MVPGSYLSNDDVRDFVITSELILLQNSSIIKEPNFIDMTKRMYPKSLKKYIRKEKARIRKDVLDKNEQKEHIKALYQRVKQDA